MVIKQKYFTARAYDTIISILTDSGLHYEGGNSLLGPDRRSIFNSYYVFSKGALTLGEYLVICHKLKSLLKGQYIDAVILKLDGAKIAVVHPKLTLPCDEDGLIDNRVRYPDDLTAEEYEKKYPQNCIIGE